MSCLSLTASPDCQPLGNNPSTCRSLLQLHKHYCPSIHLSKYPPTLSHIQSNSKLLLLAKRESPELGVSQTGSDFSCKKHTGYLVSGSIGESWQWSQEAGNLRILIFSDKRTQTQRG